MKDSNDRIEGILDKFLCPNAKSQSKYYCPIEENYLRSSVHHFFFIHDIFHLDARAVELIRGCVAIFIMAYIYCPSWIFKLTKIPKLFDDSFPYSLKPDLNRIIRAKIISNYAYSNFVSQDSQVLYSSFTIKFDFVKESVTLNFASHSSGMVSIFFCLWFSVYQRLFSTLSSYFRVKKINK